MPDLATDIEPAAAGGEWTSVFARYRRSLRGYLGGFTRSPHDVDDLMQETFLHVWTGGSGSREIHSPRAYLFRTARHVAIDTLRQRETRPAFAPLDESSEAVTDPAPPLERQLAAREEIAMLLDVVQRMPPQCRKVFLYRKLYGLSHKEIAARMGLSVRTVENHVARGMKECRALMPAEGREGNPP
jgi:RNA polymerase sigma factor (sigma-70 family)